MTFLLCSKQYDQLLVSGVLSSFIILPVGQSSMGSNGCGSIPLNQVGKT